MVYQNPDIFRTRSIFRTLAYSQRWYNQNPVIFRTLAYSKSEAYSEPCQTSTMKRFAKIVNGYNHFHKLQLFSQSLPRWNKYLEVVSPEVLMVCKKLWHTGDREFLICLLIYSKILAYLQLITVLVYGSSSLKSQ